MTLSLAAFQSGLGRALRGEDTSPIDADSAGFRFTAEVRRSWCEGRASIAARAVLTLIPEAERKRIVAEYVDQGGGLAMFPSSENGAFLEFLAPRLAEPSHALSLCRMDQALTRARLGSETFDASAVRPFHSRVDRAVRERIEREVWRCIERALQGQLEIGAPARVQRDVWDCLEADVDVNAADDFWERFEHQTRARIDNEVWHCIESSVQGRIERNPCASLVWFHADPEDVLGAVHGGPQPPVGEPAYPLLFSPGLPNLYRVATAEEAALWTRLPADDAQPALVERLLAEGVVAYCEPGDR